MINYSRINQPIAYLITYTTYGTWLHGNKSGSIEKRTRTHGTILIAPNRNLENFEKSILKDRVFIMDAQQQQIVLNAILEVCRFRNWDAYAVHVRTNHTHAVISAATTPEKIMNDFKIYATRALRKEASNSLPEKLWTRHGSSKYLWSEKELSAAVNYVRDGQGKMTAFGHTVVFKG